MLKLLCSLQLVSSYAHHCKKLHNLILHTAWFAQKSSLEDKVNKILSALDNNVMALFINKKIVDIGPLYQLNAKIWLIQFLCKWCRKDILAVVNKNQHKINTRYRY